MENLHAEGDLVLRVSDFVSHVLFEKAVALQFIVVATHQFVLGDLIKQLLVL